MPVSAGDDWERIVESIPQMVWLGAPDGQTQYVNRLTREYTGRPLEAHTGSAWLDLVHPDDAERARESWEGSVHSGKGYDSEFRIRRIDGIYRWQSLRASPMRGNDGEIERWIGTLSDIEEPRRLERSLVAAVGAAEEADSLLGALQAAAPVALGFVNSEFCLVQANDEFAGIGQHSVAGQIGQPIAEALPALWPQIESACRRVLEAGETVSNVPVVGSANGDADRVHHWLASCYPVEADQQVIGVGVVALDVTELSQATEFRSAVLSRVADGVIAIDEDGRVAYANVAACEMLGADDGELRGRFLHDVIHLQRPDGTPIPTADRATLVSADGRAGRGLGEVVRADASLVSVEYSAMPLRVGANADGVVVVFRETSEPDATGEAIRLLVLGSHAVVSEAFAVLVDTQEGLDLVGTATTSAEGIEAAIRLSPDVVLVDADLSDLDGIATARVLTDALSDASVVLVAQAYDAEVVRAALRAGCAAVLDKTQPFHEVVAAVQAVHEGRVVLSKRELVSVLPPRPMKSPEGAEFLTPREVEVLACISEGLSNRAVAAKLGVSPNTVRNHVQRVLFKLNVHSKLEAIVMTRQGSTFPT